MSFLGLIFIFVYLLKNREEEDLKFKKKNIQKNSLNNHFYSLKRGTTN
jgi:hypothetical protein